MPTGRDFNAGRRGGGTTKKNAFCSFCRKSYRDVGPLVEGPGDVYIWYTDGLLECRDPSSATGDKNPSASVADGSSPVCVLPTPHLRALELRHRIASHMPRESFH